jgi:23S rRNA (uridine2552-2'-O)-methyltransferase
MARKRKGGTGSGEGAKRIGPGGGARSLAVRLRTARGRKVSSQRWLERQLNDPYVASAKREGRRSRAAYKLIEIDDKAHILRPGQRIVDLGAAPGGWSEVAAERVQSTTGRGQVIAIDILPMEPLAGVTFLEGDFLEEGMQGRLRAALREGKADVVLSDMAAPTIGHTATDHLRIMMLAEAAAHFAVGVLAPGGTFLCKVFQGGTERELLDVLKQSFKTVRHMKPPASRAESAELYVLAAGLKPESGS